MCSKSFAGDLGHSHRLVSLMDSGLVTVWLVDPNGV